MSLISPALFSLFGELNSTRDMMASEAILSTGDTDSGTFIFFEENGFCF